MAREFANVGPDLAHRASLQKMRNTLERSDEANAHLALYRDALYAVLDTDSNTDDYFEEIRARADSLALEETRKPTRKVIELISKCMATILGWSKREPVLPFLCLFPCFFIFYLILF